MEHKDVGFDQLAKECDGLKVKVEALEKYKAEKDKEAQRSKFDIQALGTFVFNPCC